MVARDQQLRAPSKAESLAYHGVGAECLEAQSRVTLCNAPFVGLLGVVFLKKKTKASQRDINQKLFFFRSNYFWVVQF